MSRVTADLQYKTLVECNYCYPNEVLDDIKAVSTDFPDLQLYMDFSYFPNNDKRKLVHLDGTVPVTYEGNNYNIPVCIWIHETHPKNPPRCNVCLSPSMVINAKSNDVDAHGRVLLNCLSNWKIGWSNLSIVLEEMVAAFQRETPLFATYPTRTLSLSSQAEHSCSSSMQNSSAAQHGVSISTVNQHANNTLPKSTKSSL
ncbi:tumor susceptibility gene 101 protein-like [Xyrauchen texanus]|uniref:tumor susceptibility gene 101 protein-like n=1 Tax=Xyrauchen texanus TaxID=154827 RepID=UPI002241E160|nr:tumor susceptibility gene 101 protein-like [Xyrauchen texanus]